MIAATRNSLRDMPQVSTAKGVMEAESEVPLESHDYQDGDDLLESDFGWVDTEEYDRE